MKQKLMAAALIFLCAGGLRAQTAGHQRTGVEGDENWVFAAGISIGAAEADYGGGPAIEIDPSFSLEILYKQRFGLSIEVPAVLWLALNREASPRAAAAMGDPSVAAAYTFRLEDWRLGAELSYTYPLGVWDSCEARERRIVSGSGYRKLGAAFSAVRYLDPLVAGVEIGADTCLNRKEHFGTGAKPLILTASLFATEALNDVAALSAGLSQRLSWPGRGENSPYEAGPGYSLSGRISLVFDEHEKTLRLEVSKLLSDFASPLVFEMGFSLRLSGKE